MNAQTLPVLDDLQDDGDLVLVAHTIGGGLHSVAGHFNRHLPEFIRGLISVEPAGGHSSIALFRGTKRQIETAKREGRL